MGSLVDSKEYKKKIGSKPRNRSKVWENSFEVNELLASGEKDKNQKFKLLVREGIPDEVRCVVWTKMLKIYELPDYDRDFNRSKESLLQTVRIRDSGSKESQAYTAFGGIFNPEKFALTKEGQYNVKVILEIIAHEFPTLEYCAYLPALVALISHQLEPDDALGAVRLIVQKSLNRSSSDTWEYFPINLADTMLFHTAFKDLMKQVAPKIYKHIKGFGEFSPLWIRWLDGFLLDVLSLPAALRLLDSFLVEGFKIIYRYCAAVLMLKSAEILKCNNVAEVDALFEKNLVGDTWEEEEKLSRQAFAFSFSREHIKQFVLNGKNTFSPITTGSSFEGGGDNNRRHLPKIMGKSLFLNELNWEWVWTWIPRRFKSLDVELLFSTERNGYNINTLYQVGAYKEPQILFVQTLTDEIFGAYLSDAWNGKTGGNKFFGNAETFLFTLTAGQERNYGWVGLKQAPDHEKRTRDITENASLFIFGNYQYMAVGGGGVHFGLSLDETLSKGTTGKCLTFENQPLNGKPAGTFEVKHVEVWSFV